HDPDHGCRPVRPERDAGLPERDQPGGTYRAGVEGRYGAVGFVDRVLLRHDLGAVGERFDRTERVVHGGCLVDPSWRGLAGYVRLVDSDHSTELGSDLRSGWFAADYRRDDLHGGAGAPGLAGGSTSPERRARC